MKGLLLKDIYMAAKYCRVYLLMTAVFAVLSIWSSNPFFLFYPILLTSVIPVNLISYDEKSKWSLYAETLPYSRKEIVSVKYFVTLIFLGISILMIGIAQAINIAVSRLLRPDTLTILLILLPVVGVVGPSFMLPVIFKYGVEKGRIIFYAAIIGLCAMIGSMGALSMDADFTTSHFLKSAWLPPLFFAAGAGLFAVSWLLSIHFYEQREIN